MGFLGLVIAFGHSILAMSGEETLAQVYREVESPKLPNFKKAAFIVFVYSLLLTGIVSFLAVMMIKDDLRMTKYKDNLLGGLAMQMAGPLTAQLLLNAFVVVVGFLILSGAVNTSIIGSNGVLEPRGGGRRTARLVPQAAPPIRHHVSHLLADHRSCSCLRSSSAAGDVILLGEAYAFGVVWSFAFKTLSMMVLRFKDRTPARLQGPLQSPHRQSGDPDRPGHHLPHRLRLGPGEPADEGSRHDQRSWPSLRRFLTVFVVTEYINEHRRRGAKHEHLEQFNQQVLSEIKAGGFWAHQALPQAGGHPLAAQLVHARKGPGGERPQHDRRRRDDGQNAGSRRRDRHRPASTSTTTTSN